MRTVLFAIPFVTAAVFGAAAVASDDGMAIIDNGATITRACKDGTNVDVMGNKNDITLTGECGTVTVSGNKNKVVIEASAVISVLGNKNTVVWERGVGDKDPKISSAGTDNKVSKKK